MKASLSPGKEKEPKSCSSLVLSNYEENVMTSFKSNLLLMIFWFNIINYNS